VSLLGEQAERLDWGGKGRVLAYERTRLT
jgi:hypothetical protein